MLTVDTSSIALMATGAALAASGFLFSKVRRMEERCEFLLDAREDLNRAFDSADELLSDKRIDGAIRSMFLHLLYAHAHPKVGREFALQVVTPREKTPVNQDNSLRKALTTLGRSDPELERLAHRTFMSLIMNLTFLHLHDNFEVRKVQMEASRDPSSVWSKAWSAFGSGSNNSGHNGAIPA